MLRSSNVPGSLRISAIAFGHHVENDRGSWSSPTARITVAVVRVWPEFNTPRNSSLWRRKVSASSINSVGAYFSMVRKRAAGVTFDANIRRGTRAPSTISSNVFPHRFCGEVMAKIGEAKKAAIA